MNPVIYVSIGNLCVSADEADSLKCFYSLAVQDTSKVFQVWRGRNASRSKAQGKEFYVLSAMKEASVGAQQKWLCWGHSGHGHSCKSDTWEREKEAESSMGERPRTPLPFCFMELFKSVYILKIKSSEFEPVVAISIMVNPRPKILRVLGYGPEENSRNSCQSQPVESSWELGLNRKFGKDEGQRQE